MEPISTIGLISAIKTTFDLIEKALSERASASALRDHLTLVKERLSFVNDQADSVLKKVSQLQQENAELKHRVVKLESELKTYQVPENLVEHRGALFQRKPDGSYRQQVLCPTCRKITSPVDSSMPYRCGECGWHSTFKARQLSQVMEGLPS